jgi:hypothetical protein
VSSSLVWLVWSSLLGTAAVVAVALDLSSVVRAPIVLAFVLVCPGLALIRLVGVRTATAQLSLGIALSLALDVLVPASLLYAGVWSPSAALGILVGVTFVAAMIEVVLPALDAESAQDSGARV